MFRGLGMLCKQQGDVEHAKLYLQAYLDQPTPPKDRLYIQHQLEQLN